MAHGRKPVRFFALFKQAQRAALAVNFTIVYGIAAVDL